MSQNCPMGYSLPVPRADFFFKAAVLDISNKNKCNVENQKLTHILKEPIRMKRKEGFIGFQDVQQSRSPKETGSWLSTALAWVIFKKKTGSPRSSCFTHTPALRWYRVWECNFLGVSSILGELRRVWVYLVSSDNIW